MYPNPIIGELCEHSKRTCKSRHWCFACQARRKFLPVVAINDEYDQCALAVCSSCAYILFTNPTYGLRLGCPSPQRLRRMLGTPVGGIVRDEQWKIRMRDA